MSTVNDDKFVEKDVLKNTTYKIKSVIIVCKVISTPRI